MRKRISIIFLLVIVTMISGCAEIFELGLMTTGSTHLQATAKMPKTESSGYLPHASKRYISAESGVYQCPRI